MKHPLITCAAVSLAALLALLTHAGAAEVASNAPASGDRAGSIHVSPMGDDSNSGAADQPVRSFERALEIARSRKGGAPIHLAKDALIVLSHPIRLDARDSGLHVIGHGARLTGGAAVVGWQAGEDGIWRAKCPVDGAPRELFVNGRRAVRARFPNAGWLRIDQALPDRRSGFTFNAGDIPGSIKAGDGLELVFLHDWSMSRIAISSIDQGSRTLRTPFPIGSDAPHYAIDNFEKHPRYALEGSPLLLDGPGEWAMSGDQILYRPRTGETIAEVTAIVPRLTQLLEIAPGEDGKVVSDIGFEGVTFAHCRFDLPAQGYASAQATMHDLRDGSGKSGRKFIPAAVRVSGATKVVFARCSFTHLGGSGLWIGQGSSDCAVEQCEFTDISGNGINLGEQVTENVATRISVTDSLVRDCGKQFHGSVGIWIGMASSCRVERCEISQLPYTGISVGWRWNPEPSPCKQHTISDNHIHHVMQVLSDGGGIYTLGRQPGTVLKGNHIHDVPLNAGRAQSNGIFMDEGTTDILVEANLIHAIAKSPIRFHRAGENIIRGNILGIAQGQTAFTFNSTDAKVITFENNRELAEGSKELKAAIEMVR